MNDIESCITDTVFQVEKNVVYVVSIDGNRKVTILEPQQSKIQQVFRKIGLNIPKYKQISLEGYGSFVFLLINGSNTIYEMGQKLEQQFGGQTHPLYPRLNLFLNYLEGTGYITKVQ